MMRSCASSATFIASGTASHRLVDDCTSVKTKVTCPSGAASARLAAYTLGALAVSASAAMPAPESPPAAELPLAREPLAPSSRATTRCMMAIHSRASDSESLANLKIRCELDTLKR
jgi:hypothetical protein